jgi:hypothetical protein
VLVRPVAGVKAAAATGHSAYLSATTETTHLAAPKATETAAARFSFAVSRLDVSRAVAKMVVIFLIIFSVQF